MLIVIIPLVLAILVAIIVKYLPDSRFGGGDQFLALCIIGILLLVSIFLPLGVWATNKNSLGLWERFYLLNVAAYSVGTLPNGTLVSKERFENMTPDVQYRQMMLCYDIREWERRGCGKTISWEYMVFKYNRTIMSMRDLDNNRFVGILVPSISSALHLLIVRE